MSVSLLSIILEYVEGSIDPATGQRVYPFGKPVRVFPCTRGREDPLPQGGYKVASANPDQARAWWDRWPWANVAVPMGLNGLVVLAVDGAPGLDSLDKLIAENEPLPPTLTARTPSNGRHYIFRVNDPAAKSTGFKDSVSLLGPGLDIHADGGYACVYPSIVDGQFYQWVEPMVPPAPLPKWLAKAIRVAMRARKAVAAEVRHGA